MIILSFHQKPIPLDWYCSKQWHVAPVAAYNVSGPKDVIGKSKAGILREDLAEAVRGLESLSASTAIKHAKKFSWEKASENFFSYLHIG